MCRNYNQGIFFTWRRQMVHLHWRRMTAVLNHSGHVSVQMYVEWQLSSVWEASTMTGKKNYQTRVTVLQLKILTTFVLRWQIPDGLRFKYNITNHHIMYHMDKHPVADIAKYRKLLFFLWIIWKKRGKHEDSSPSTQPAKRCVGMWLTGWAFTLEPAA